MLEESDKYSRIQNFYQKIKTIKLCVWKLLVLIGKKFPDFWEMGNLQLSLYLFIFLINSGYSVSQDTEPLS